MEEKILNYKPTDSKSSTFCSNIKSSIHNILIIRPGALGDLVVTLPTFEAIRKYFKNARVDIMGYSSFLEIVKGRFYADTISRFDQADIASLFTKNSNVPASLINKLSNMDLIIAFVSDKDQVMVNNLRAAGVKHVIHYEPFPSEGEDIHIIDHFLRCLGLLGVTHSNKIPKIFLNDEDELFGEKFLNESIVKPDKLLVVMHPGSGSRQKCWPTDRYVELILWLKKEMDARILLISGQADTGIVEALRDKVRDNFILADQLPLPILAAIIKRSNLFVGNDSGIAHVAAAVGTPTITIFGPTDPGKWGPRGERVKILYKKSPCSPCSFDTRRNCFSQICLEGVTVEDVISEIRYMKQYSL
ncbi:MAG TPA: glycosyltransferase family 9 protein [Candidatus Wunengus sp. YC64]|uniref:glycosyltransferase family 9 protein n=1 Tax=Candidatus Wunengus sp. YC64 TaxID=3367700 RepID=UPI0040282B0D